MLRTLSDIFLSTLGQRMQGEMKAACVGTGSCNISMGGFCAGIGITPAAFKLGELPIPFLHPAENRFGAPPALFVTGMCPGLYGDVVKPRTYIGNASVPSLVFLPVVLSLWGPAYVDVGMEAREATAKAAPVEMQAAA